MLSKLAWPIAVVSVIAFLWLWFWEVRRIMRNRKSTAESAVSQLKACREKGVGVRYDPELAEVILRSESIYQQAVVLYMRTLKKPWIWLPAVLMGFRHAPDVDSVSPEVQEEPADETVEQPQKPDREPYFGSVRFFKNLILLAVIVMIGVPSGFAICLNRDLRSTEQSLQQQAEETDALRQEYERLQKLQEQKPVQPEAEPAPSFWESFQAESPYGELYPDFYAPQELGTSVRETGVIYLTFDDGPSARTEEILNILREKDVKATFFVIGSRDESADLLLKRIVEEGHTLAMHSYSHNYEKIYASVEDYLADMYQIFTQIQEATGVAPTLFRFPGGSINGYSRDIYQELIAEMLRRGFVPYDWNISNEDSATNRLVPVNELVSNVVSRAEKVERGIVLMHDSTAKTTTVQALGPMIDRLRELGFELKALTPEVMPVLYAYQG